MSIKLIIQLVAIMAISCVLSACTSKNNIDKVTLSNIHNSNYNISRDLFYNEHMNEIKIYFGCNISKLDIRKIELYQNSNVVYDNVEISNQYDNVLIIKLNKIVAHFNIIKLYDKNDNFIDFYTGDYYLEEYKVGTGKDSIDFKSSTKIFDNSIEINLRIKKEIESKYEIDFVIPKRLENIFNVATKKIKEEDSNYLIKYTLEFKNKKQIGLFLKKLCFNVIVQSKDKETGKLNYFTKIYIPVELQ